MAARGQVLLDRPSLYLLLAVVFLSLAIYGFTTAMPQPATWHLANQVVPAMLIPILLYVGYRSLLAAPFLILSPWPWFLASFTLYYGLGPLVYYVGTKDAIYIARRYYPIGVEELLRTNLLNAVAITTITLVFVSSMKLHSVIRPISIHVSPDLIRVRRNEIKMAVMIMLAISLPVKYLFGLPHEFGMLESPLPGSIQQLQGMVAGAITLLVVLALQLGGLWIWLFGLVFGAELLVGILQFSKMAVVVPLLMVFIGFFLCHRRRLVLIGGLVTFVVAYLLTTPLVNYGRSAIVQQSGSHYQMGLAGRLTILGDYLTSDLEESIDELEGAWWARLNYANFQAFVMREYDRGSPGNSIALARYVLIPRLVWTEKPILSATGNELNYVLTGNPDSSTGIGVFAEAYWSGGWPLVFMVCGYIGLLFAGFTIYAMRRLAHYDLIYLPVLFIGVRIGFRPDGWFATEYVMLPLFAIVLHVGIRMLIGLIPMDTLFQRRRA